MNVDLKRNDVQAYINSFPRQRREAVLRVLDGGGEFYDAFNSDRVKIILEIISGKISDEIRDIVTLVKKGKYNKDGEINEIKKHCLRMSALIDLVDTWQVSIDSFMGHAEKIVK